MNNTRIIPQIEKNYIDTLYLYTNLQNFDDSNKSVNVKYTDLYNKIMLQINADTTIQKITDNALSGYARYKFPNYDLFILHDKSYTETIQFGDETIETTYIKTGYERAKASNKFNCIIKYNHSHIFPLDLSLTGLDLPFGSDRTKYHIRQIDITKTAQLSIDYTTDAYKYIYPWQSQKIHTSRGTFSRTVYLGEQYSSNFFRMYNKSKELHDKQNATKIDLYSKYFGGIDDLYTFEHSMSRDFLKSQLGVDILDDLPMLLNASQNMVSKIRFYQNTDKNNKLIKQKHYTRINYHVLVEHVDYARVPRKKYAPSRQYLINSIYKQVSKHLETSDLSKSDDEYLKIFSALFDQKLTQNPIKALSHDLLKTFSTTY